MYGITLLECKLCFFSPIASEFPYRVCPLPLLILFLDSSMPKDTMPNWEEHHCMLTTNWLLGGQSLSIGNVGKRTSNGEEVIMSYRKHGLEMGKILMKLLSSASTFAARL